MVSHEQIGAFDGTPSLLVPAVIAREPGTPSTPPPPFVAGIEQDREGLLWVFVRVAGRSWKEAWPSLPKGTHEVPVSTIQMDKLFGTIIEVIDPRLGRVIARTSFDDYFVAPLPNRRGAIYSVDDHGEGRVVIVSLELVRP